MRVTTRF